MVPTVQSVQSYKFVERKAVLLFLLLLPSLSSTLVVKVGDIADLQLAQLEAQAELVEDKTLPLECRRKVKNM